MNIKRFAAVAIAVATVLVGKTASAVIITPIDLNDFLFIAGDPVSIAPDGSSATLGEDAAFSSIPLFNDPFFGDPEVVIGGPLVELKFEFDFSEPARVTSTNSLLSFLIRILGSAWFLHLSSLRIRQVPVL